MLNLLCFSLGNRNRSKGLQGHLMISYCVYILHVHKIRAVGFNKTPLFQEIITDG
jgi:hypothetical protein